MEKVSDLSGVNVCNKDLSSLVSKVPNHTLDCFELNYGSLVEAISEPFDNIHDTKQAICLIRSLIVTDKDLAESLMKVMVESYE